MSARVEFQDFSIQVREAMSDAVITALHTMANELMSQAQRKTSVGKVSGGKTKGAWKYVVDESKQEATVGNTEENAIWEEFGTGEYALEGKGRHGGWYIPIGDGEGMISQQVVDAYHMTVRYGKDKKKYAYTTGKKPKRMLHNAFVENRAKLIRLAEDILKERLD